MRFPSNQPIVMGANRRRGPGHRSWFLAWVTLKGYVPYLWREWLTSVADHKRIGIMYIILALIHAAAHGFAPTPS